MADYKPVPKTFYQRPLPDSCTRLSSPLGKKYFRSAMQGGGLKSFFSLMEQHSTQTEPAFCGLSTLVIVLNALAIDPRQSWKGPWRWYDESMLNCCVDLDSVKRTGITLSKFHCLAICQGLITELHYGIEEDGKNTSNTEKDGDGLLLFRDAVNRACVEPYTQQEPIADDTEPQTILVVSYSRKILGQTGSGHFSPIAAYDKESDHVLILDTARFKYGAHWVPLPLVFQAMQPVDTDTGRSRGYVLLSAPCCKNKARFSDDCGSTTSSKCSCPPPDLRQAMLLWSPMRQREARRRFKETFLQNGAALPTFEQIVDFSTQGGKNRAYVWNMTQAQLRPCSEDYDSPEEAVSALALIDEMLKILNDLIQGQPVSDSFTAIMSNCCESHCRSNYSRTLDVSSAQASFLLFLAVLPETRRQQILFAGIDEAANGDASIEFTARQQLLAEAELLRVAIDVSDSGEL